MFCIVSAYYDIPSKQPASNYYRYITLFFKFIKDIPILFFTDSKNYEKLNKLSGDNVKFIIKEFEELDIFKTLPIEFWKQQIQVDPEKYHTWQLGAIWASKGFFVKHAISHTDNYDFYMWVDAGCVRTESWSSVLEKFGKRNIELTKNIYVQLLNPLPTKQYLQYPDIFVAGSHILFHKSLVDTYLQKYIETIFEYTKHLVPVIMDQYIIATLTCNNNFIKPILYDERLSAVDKWFFFFHLF